MAPDSRIPGTDQGHLALVDTMNRGHPGISGRMGDVDEERQHPVTSGLTALVAVALVVGLFLGLVAFVGFQVLGIGGGSSADGHGAGGASLYLPTPSETDSNVGPVVSLAPGSPSDGYSTLPGDTSAASATAGTSGLTLSTPQPSVGPGQRIELTGSGPEGHLLTVQRLQNGQWVGFAGIEAHVRAGLFQTWVQTSQVGDQQWRVGDPATGAVSNPVTVVVG